MNNLNGGVLKCSKLEPPEWMYSPVFTRAMLASAGISCCCVYVCPSVTSRWCTETAKHRITQTTPHDSPGTLVFLWRKHRQNSNGVTPNWGAKCRWGRLNADALAENWRLSTDSVVNLVRSQVYHTERPPDLFAARSPWCSASRRFVSNSWSLFSRLAQNSFGNLLYYVLIKIVWAWSHSKCIDLSLLSVAWS